jgi:hypothetical protein
VADLKTQWKKKGKEDHSFCQNTELLSENSKKEYPKSVTELLKLEEKRFLQGVCYPINNIP